MVLMEETFLIEMMLGDDLCEDLRNIFKILIEL